MRANKQLGLYYAGFGTSKQLEDRVLNHLFWNKYFSSELPRQAADFEKRLSAGRSELVSYYHSYEQTLIEALSLRFEIVRSLEALQSPAYANTRRDIHEQLAGLFGENYPEGLSWQRFLATPGYLHGVIYRLDHLQGRVDKDQRSMNKLADARKRLVRAQEALTKHSAQGVSAESLEGFWIALEEWRLALFAQPLGRHNGMSDKKVGRRLEELEIRLGLR